jgi:hypothetical protein
MKLILFSIQLTFLLLLSHTPLLLSGPGMGAWEEDLEEELQGALCIKCFILLCLIWLLVSSVQFVIQKLTSHLNIHMYVL